MPTVVNSLQQPVTRVFATISQPISTVLTSLHYNIGTNAWPPPDRGIFSSPESFEAYTTSKAGQHGLMHFQTYDFTPLLGLYQEGTGRRVTRIVLGNPSVARTFVRHDVRGALFAPISILLLEEENGTTTVMYDLPSSLIVNGDARDNQELVDAAKVLDDKVKALVDWLGSDEAGAAAETKSSAV